LRIVVRQPLITGRGGRALLQYRRQELLRSALLGVTKVLAIARSIVEPDVSRQLIVAVHRFAKALPYRLIAKSVKKGSVDCGRRLREVESHERGVSFSPYRRPRTSTC